MANLISTTGPVCPNVTDTPLDNRSRVSTIAGIGNIPLAWKGMLVYCEENGITYKVTSLKSKRNGPVEIENYYPATWVEFGSGGSTPSPTPSVIDAGDVHYSSSGTFSNDTVGNELQSLASDISGLLEDIHNLSGDIGTLSSLDTEYQQDLVGAINEVLGITDDKVAGIKVQGESSVLPMDSNGIVTIPASGGGTVNATWGSITGTIANQTDLINIASLTNYYTKTQLYTKTEVDALIQGGGSSVTVEDNLNSTSAVNALSANQGRVLKGLINEVNNKILQLGGDPEPIVIPPSAVELPVPTSNPDYIDYDSDTTYVMNIDGTQVATIHYPYIDNSNNYVAFKAIDRDLYYAYIVSVVNDAERYTYSNQYTWSTLPTDAKSKFESGIYAIKQVINDDGTLPEKKWYKNIPSVFVDKNNLPLRSRRIDETISSSVIDVVLVKNDRLNKIYRYAFNVSHNTWVLINGGCYTKDDANTGENYTKYDAYFDRQPASNVSFDDSVTQLGTQEDPVTDVQSAINQLATGIQGLTGKLKIHLLYQNSTPVANKEVSISVSYRGTSYDISSQYSPSTEGFITDSNGYVINNNSNEYLVLPLGATYNITLYDISDNYITPDNKTGIIDANTVTVNCIYDNVSNNEFVKVYVQLPNTPTSVATVENKKVYVDFYTTSTTHSLQYVCILRANGTVKQILEADGVTQATFNGEPLISATDPVLIPVPNGTKYTCALQEWDETISSESQRYVKSADQTYTASRAKRTLTFTYTDRQLGLFLLVSDSTQTKGYRSCLIININSTTSFTIKDVVNNESVTYIITRSSSNVYRQVEGDSNTELWEETILGVGVRTSQSVFESNDDTNTQGEYPDCSFFVPITMVSASNIAILNEDTVEVSLPSNYGGLYLTKCLYNLGPSPKSPAAHKCIDETTFDISLQIPTGYKTIKAFIPSSQQALVVRGCKSNFDSIWNIITGSAFAMTMSNNNFWTSTKVTSVQYNNSFVQYTRTNVSTPNPADIVGSTSNGLFVVYPY